MRGKKQFDEIIAVAVAEETLAAVFARAAPWEGGGGGAPIKMKYDDVTAAGWPITGEHGVT